MDDGELYITELLNLDPNNEEDAQTIQEVDEELRQSYGLTYEEYKDIRNSLLVAHNFELPLDIFVAALENKITIDLVSQGLLEVSDLFNNKVRFKVSTKGEALISENLSLPISWSRPFHALMFLRNSDVI